MPRIIKQDATDPIAPDINPEQFAQVGTRYRTFLLTRGMDAERALQQGDLVDGFVREQLPSGVATQAINQLRQLARGRRPRGGAIEAAAPYPGRHACAQTAVEYLAAHYGEAIQDGRLTPSNLSRIDKRLYAAVEAGRGGPVGVCFARIRSEERRATGRVPRYLAACGGLLQRDPVTASAFFAGVRQPNSKDAMQSADQVAATFFQDACSRYEAFLISQGFTPHDAGERTIDFALFAAKELPNIGALAAVQELREQADLWTGRFGQLYPSRHDQVSPLLRFAYAQRDGEAPSNLIRSRQAACAAVLGTSSSEACAFFSSARRSPSVSVRQ